MSRTLAYLAELQPEMFVEVSPELAAERGLEHLGWAHVVTARAAIEARVLVTERLRPLRVDGRVHPPGLAAVPLGQGGLTTGDSANDLVGITLDPNVLIQESKVGHLRHAAGPAADRAGAGRLRRRLPAPCRRRRGPRHRLPSPHSVPRESGAGGGAP